MDPAKDLPTPFYLFSEEILRTNWETLYNSFLSFWPNFAIAYSYKTNPLKFIARYLHSMGALAEVTSEHELGLAKTNNPKSLIYNGIFKPEEELANAIMLGAKIHIDGEEQLNTLIELIEKKNITAHIGIRLSRSMINSGYCDQFGFELLNQNDFDTLFNKITKIKNIRIRGIHCHLGTNIKDFNIYESTARMFGEIYNKLRGKGIELSWIDIGGGFISSTDSAVYRRYAECISRGLKKSNVKKDTQLIIEPGRALVESAGVLVTKVVDIRYRKKSNSTYIIVNSGTNFIIPFKLVNDRKIFKVNYSKGNFVENYQIAGVLCSNEDIIAENVNLNKVKIGDKIIISNVGAYDISTAYSFSRLRPSVFNYTENKILCLAREAETSDYVIGLEPNIC